MATTLDPIGLVNILKFKIKIEATEWSFLFRMNLNVFLENVETPTIHLKNVDKKDDTNVRHQIKRKGDNFEW